jgi:GNAT superfamily N-acetyltransferase
MEKQEMAIALKWAAAEGWNPGLYDGDCFYSIDPQGFFIGELDGEPVGCISAVAYDDSFGFIGFYIVKPEFRGRGLGIQIWNAAMVYLGGRNIGLDGVPAQEGNYGKSGFRLAWRNARYEGTKGALLPGTGGRAEGVKGLSDFSLEEVEAYDRLAFPAPRRGFLECWTGEPHALSLGITSEGSLAGYGCIRPCLRGFKIGPLFADRDVLAERLFLSLIEFAGDEPFFLDVPEENAAAAALAHRYGMVKAFNTARMYTKERPPIDIRRVFGITTFEMG